MRCRLFKEERYGTIAEGASAGTPAPRHAARQPPSAGILLGEGLRPLLPVIVGAKLQALRNGVPGVLPDAQSCTHGTGPGYPDGLRAALAEAHRRYTRQVIAPVGVDLAGFCGCVNRV